MFHRVLKQLPGTIRAVNRAVGGAVWEAVYEAAKEDANHPALFTWLYNQPHKRGEKQA